MKRIAFISYLNRCAWPPREVIIRAVITIILAVRIAVAFPPWPPSLYAPSGSFD